MTKYFSLLLLLISINSFSQIIVDEAYLDMEFLKFKTELMSCVLQKDSIKLKNFLAERVFESKDGYGYPGATKDEFIQYYFSENADDSWNEIRTVLRFGFRRYEDENPERIVPHDKIIFQAPSFLKDVDTDNELLILGENVNIRAQPSLQAPIIRTTSYEKFKCDCNIITMTNKTYQTVDGIDWIEIKLSDNKIGYVAANLTSFNIVKEMTIAKVNGSWKIISWFHAPGC